MKQKLLTVLGCIFSAAAINAAFVPDKVLFEETFATPESLKTWGVAGARPAFIKNGGPDGKSNAVRFSVLKQKGTSCITKKLDPEKINGMIVFEGWVKGEDVKATNPAYLGTKFMLAHGKGKKISYPEPARTYGTYGWKRVCRYINIEPGADHLALMLGIQEGIGTYYVANIRISSLKQVSEEEAQNINKPKSNPMAAAIPRGKGGTKYRGVMSGRDLSPEAFAELGRWNVNLIRFQRSQNRKKNESYMQFIDRIITELDAILPLCKKYGIKVVIDVHSGPGTTINKVASNILTKDTNVELFVKGWQKLAAHYKDNPQIYGYDLLNEPGATTFIKGQENPWKYMAETAAKAIRQIDQKTPIIVAWHQCEPFTIDVPNVIYTPHFYSPHEYTHQGVSSKNLFKWTYPGEINGVYWDKEQMRCALKSIIEFQKKHNLKIFIGEFGAILWVPSGRDQYIRDCIEIFEEYGWDWTYHAFREWIGWSAEHVIKNGEFVKTESPTQRVLMNAMKKNKH